MLNQARLAAELAVGVHLEIKKDRQRNSSQLLRPSLLPSPNLRRRDIQDRLPQSLCKTHQFHVESGIINSQKRKATLIAKGGTEHIEILAQSSTTRQHIAKTGNREMFKIH